MTRATARAGSAAGSGVDRLRNLILDDGYCSLIPYGPAVDRVFESFKTGLHLTVHRVVPASALRIIAVGAENQPVMAAQVFDLYYINLADTPQHAGRIVYREVANTPRLLRGYATRDVILCDGKLGLLPPRIHILNQQMHHQIFRGFLCSLLRGCIGFIGPGYGGYAGARM